MKTADESSKKKDECKISDNLFFLAVCLCVWCFIYFLSSRVELISDDWHFKFVFNGFMPGDNEKRISGINDIIISMKQFYELSGGRLMAHSVLQLILMADKSLFDIINAFFFVACGLIIYKISVAEEKKDHIYLIFVYLLLLLFIPSFGDTCIWVSGAVNYLWMSIFYLAYFYFDKKNSICGKLIFAFISGFTNEPMGGMIIVFLIARSIIKWKRPSKEDILCCFLALLGTIFILIAPGNKSRALIVNQTTIFSFESAFDCMGKTLNWIINDGLLFILVVPPLLLIIFRKHFFEYIDVIALYVAGIAGIISLTLTGDFIVRAEFPCVVFLLLSFWGFVFKTVNIIKAIDADNKIKQKLNDRIFAIVKRILAVIVIAMIVFWSAINMKMFFEVSTSETQQMEKIIIAAENNSDVHIQLKKYSNPGRFYPQEVSYSNEYEALWRGMYYGITITWN